MDADQSLLPVRQASERLGISVEAVRARLSRGTLERVDGTVYVRLHDSPRSDQSTDQTLLLQRADSEIAYLRQRLAEADERDREQRRIIAGLVARVPELSSGASQSDESAPVSATEVPEWSRKKAPPG